MLYDVALHQTNYVILYCTPLCCNLLYSPLIYSTLLYSTLLHSTIQSYGLLCYTSLYRGLVLRWARRARTRPLWPWPTSASAGAWPGLGQALLGGPKGHINTRISHPGSKTQYKADTGTHVVRRILVFMWPFLVLVLSGNMATWLGHSHKA